MRQDVFGIEAGGGVPADDQLVHESLVRPGLPVEEAFVQTSETTGDEPIAAPGDAGRTTFAGVMDDRGRLAQELGVEFALDLAELLEVVGVGYPRILPKTLDVALEGGGPFLSVIWHLLDLGVAGCPPAGTLVVYAAAWLPWNRKRQLAATAGVTS